MDVENHVAGVYVGLAGSVHVLEGGGYGGSAWRGARNESRWKGKTELRQVASDRAMSM